MLCSPAPWSSGAGVLSIAHAAPTLGKAEAEQVDHCKTDDYAHVRHVR